jgi:hypothetical protein
MRWAKPGILSRYVGVGQSVLRNWAKSNLVQTMVSRGGHRLFNVKSVKRYIAATAAPACAATSTQDVQHEQSTLRAGERQIVVYLRLLRNQSTKLTKVEMQSISDQILAGVRQQYASTCSERELQACLVIVELETEAMRDARMLQGSQVAASEHISDTPGSRRLLRAICNRQRRQTLVVLQAAEDISSMPGAYSFFLILCRNMGATVDVVSNLFTPPPSSDYHATRRAKCSKVTSCIQYLIEFQHA